MLQPMSLDSNGHSPLENVSGELGCVFKTHQVKVDVHVTTQEELAVFVLYPKGLVRSSKHLVWDLAHACTITLILSNPCNVGYHNLTHLNS